MTSRSLSCRHPNRRSGKTMVIALVLLGLFGGGAFAWYSWGGVGAKLSTADMVTAVVFRGPFDHIVLEQGEVESSSNIDVICEVKSQGGGGGSTGGGGGTPILWVIEEGTYVKKGDKLVELDSSSLENQLKTQRIAVSSVEAQVISSKATVRTAEISLEEYIKGTYQQERKLILSEIAVAQQQLRRAELSLASAQRMGAKGQVKGLQIEAVEYEVVNAKNVLEAAEAKLVVLDELTFEKNKVQFESDIEAAKAKLASDESVLQEELDKLRELEDQIKKCVILSPAEGVVVHNNSYSSRGGSAEFVVEEGAAVRERQTIIKLPDPTKMQVKAKVNESRVTLIAPGMAAKVKVGAAEGDLLAIVRRVNKYAEPGNYFSSNVKEYATIIEILNPPETIRTGMTAEVRIFVEQLPDAMQMPVHCIYEYKGRHFSLKKVGEAEFETVEIEIGATNEKMVTINSGLDEGDEVVQNPRIHLDLMDLPEIEDVTDRDKLAEIGKNAQEPEAPADAGEPPPGAGGEGGPGVPGGGPGVPGGGRGGPGGRGGGGGGFDPATIADRIMSNDTNGDGKIAGDEMSGLSPNFKDRFTEFDANNDGELTRDEILEGFKNRPPGGGGRGGRGGP